MGKRFEKILFLIIVILIAGIGIAFFMKQSNAQNLSGIPVAASTPGVNIVSKDTETDVSQISPDGNQNLVMKVVSGKNNTKTYSVYVTNSLIFTKTLTDPANIALPFNTWSTDDKYVFLKETVGNQINYYVMYANGTSTADGSAYLNVSDLFAAKEPNYQLTDITGWASGTLLILNTNTAGGDKGPSFWFDITSKSFIVLSTRFD